jgi:ABC-type polysaccharide/polyol phosphate export permease
MLYGFLRDMVRLKSVIFELAKRDYQQINQGSYLGFVWNYLQPLMHIALLYGVFTIGFRQGAVQDDLPFSLYLLSGMICWLYFSGNVASITGVIRSYSFLVKKVDFRLSVLPFVKLLSSLLPHVLLLVLLLVASAHSGFPLGLHTLQLLYYFLCMAALLVGLGWITSSATLFIPDVRNAVDIITQFGMWLTPLFWNVNIIPERYRWLTELNPLCYLVTGYRESLTGTHYFWQHPRETLIFWGMTLLLLAIGTVVYRRLKPHFAEVI